MSAYVSISEGSFKALSRPFSGSVKHASARVSAYVSIPLIKELHQVVMARVKLEGERDKQLIN